MLQEESKSLSEPAVDNRTFALPCQHFFCVPCWHTTVAKCVTETNDDFSTFTCPHEGCEYVIHEDLIPLVCPSELGLAEEYKSLQILSFIDIKHDVKFCPNKVCGRIIEYPTYERSRIIECVCKTVIASLLPSLSFLVLFDTHLQNYKLHLRQFSQH